MASRASLNKVLLIGNLTRDPELRYTPSGAAVCSFGVATNRSYTASDGQKKEEAEFTKIVAWGKLGELCSQLLTKGRKVYVEGRLQTRSWETPDGQNRQTTEVIIDDMRILDSRPGYGAGGEEVPEVVEEPYDSADKAAVPSEPAQEAEAKKPAKEPKNEAPVKKNEEDQKVDLDDLPF